MTFEVSVLTPPELIIVQNELDYSREIKIGKDGVLIECGFLRGLLLPQVSQQLGLTPEEFLSECCLRAGLLADRWLQGKIRVYKFQAQTFTADNDIAHRDESRGK